METNPKAYAKTSLRFAVTMVGSFAVLYMFARGAVGGFMEYPAIGGVAFIKGSIPALLFLVWLLPVFSDIEEGYLTLRETESGGDTDVSEVDNSPPKKLTVTVIETIDPLKLAPSSMFALRTLGFIVLAIGSLLYFYPPEVDAPKTNLKALSLHNSESSK